MSTDTVAALFKIASFAAMAGWVALIAFPRARVTRLAVRSGALTAAFAILYAALFLIGEGFEFSDFNSLAGVQHLFGNPVFLLAGWVHYLAFDLFVGSWILEDSEKRRLPHWQIIPCLILTFLFGPIGYLGYLAVSRRFMKR